jgi:hypothetical protein
MSTVDRHLAAPIASPAAPPQAVWLCANWGLLVAIASSEDRPVKHDPSRHNERPQ